MTASRLFKYLAGLVLAAGLLFVLLANFSSAQSRYQCTGSFSSGHIPHPATVFVKLDQYRWWVGLWSASDGALWLEVPNATVEYFGQITRAGEQLQIFRNDNQLAGHFSTLSKTLALKLSTGVGFDGTCKGIDA